MIEVKVQKFGNSLGVVLPREVLERLRSQEGDRLFLVEDTAGDYRLTARDPAFEEKMTLAEGIMRRYRDTLRELAN